MENIKDLKARAQRVAAVLDLADEGLQRARLLLTEAGAVPTIVVAGAEDALLASVTSQPILPLSRN